MVLRERCEMSHSVVGSTNVLGVLLRQAAKHVLGLGAQLPRGRKEGRIEAVRW